MIVTDIVDNSNAWRELNATNVKYFGYHNNMILVNTNSLESLDKDILSDACLLKLYKFDEHNVESYLRRHNRKLVIY